jgi:hypothetical protein
MNQTFAATSAVVYFDQAVGKFSCKLNGKHLGSSKHFDYFEYHYHRNDITSLCALIIDEFVYLNEDGSVKEVKPTKHKPVMTADKMQASELINPVIPQNSFLNILYPTIPQSVTSAENPGQRQRGRPRKQLDNVLPANVRRNVISDDEPTITPLGINTRRMIKIEYNRMVEFNNISINEAIETLMTKYKATRSQVYNAAMG